MTKKDYVVKRLQELLTADQIKTCEQRAKNMLQVDQNKIDQKMNQYKHLERIRDKMGF